MPLLMNRTFQCSSAKARYADPGRTPRSESSCLLVLPRRVLGLPEVVDVLDGRVQSRRCPDFGLLSEGVMEVTAS